MKVRISDGAEIVDVALYIKKIFVKGKVPDGLTVVVDGISKPDGKSIKILPKVVNLLAVRGILLKVMAFEE